MANKTATISDLRIYPIKSCRGISLPSTTLTRQGLLYDRRWMFIDTSKGNKFVTIRQRSEMTLINTSIDMVTKSLAITFPASEGSDSQSTATISVPLDPDQTFLENECEKLDVDIWGINTDAYVYTSPDITTPTTNFFKSIDPDAGASYRLVMKGPTPRPTQGNGSKDQLGRTETVNFPDLLPILVATETSLADLNARLASRQEPPITIERFRPNIILSSEDLTPWEEDEWRTLRLNPPASLLASLTPSILSPSPTIDLDVSARCARCQVPNVDPSTAQKHQKEPWSLLYSFRRVDDGIKYKPCFGMLCCPRSEGVVEVGMAVVVTEVMEAAGGKKGTRHEYLKGF